MTPLHADPWLTIYQGDALSVLAELPAESVHCVVTSPPYLGLRDYGIPPSVWGGEAGHKHEWGQPIIENGTNHTDKRRWQHTRNGRDEEQPPEKRVAWRRTDVVQGAFCDCGAWSGALGLEPAPQLFVDHVVLLFREIRRVLRKDATVWLNMGDSYASHDPGDRRDGQFLNPEGKQYDKGRSGLAVRNKAGLYRTGLFKAKDRMMIPARVAIALQADGWWLRDEIVWSKPNPMPSSVQDRTTPAHEMVYLLTKSGRYWYDAAAIREPDSGQDHRRSVVEGQPSLEPSGGLMRPHRGIRKPEGRNGEGRNRRSVWTVSLQPYPGAHFATFPPKLIEPMILAGCPEGGVVLDPFAGSGTTGMVAQSLSRRAVLIDLNADYLVQALNRNRAIPLGLVG